MTSRLIFNYLKRVPIFMIYNFLVNLLPKLLVELLLAIVLSSFFLLRDKNAAKTESSVEFTTPSCASLTRGYQQLTHSGSCVFSHGQQADFLLIKIKCVSDTLPVNLELNFNPPSKQSFIKHGILLISRYDNI